MVELKMYDPEKKIIKEISIRDASKQTFAFVAFKGFSILIILNKLETINFATKSHPAKQNKFVFQSI